MNSFYKKRKLNKGMTMVEVLIGFVILLLMLGMLSGVIAFAHNMFLNAVDIKQSEEDLQNFAYKKNATNGGTRVKDSIVLKPADGMPGSTDEIEMTAEVYKVTNSYKDVDLTLYICKDVAD